MALELQKLERVRAVSHRGLTWIDVESPTRAETDFLASVYPFRPLNLEDSRTTVHLTKMDEYEDHLFILLHVPFFGNKSGQIQSSQISIFYGKEYLVTLHDANCKFHTSMFSGCRNDEKQRDALMGHSSGYLLYKIINALINELLPMVDNVNRKLDDLEDKVFDEKVSVIRHLSKVRREIADLRRIVFPMRRLIADLASKARLHSRKDVSDYFSDSRDHVEKVWETLEEAKETIEIFKDTDFILNNERTNEILGILTILFTLTIPVTVVGTLYGMNILLPGGIQTGPWTHWGPYTTFTIVLVVSLLPAGLMAWYFRRRGWF